MATSVEPGKNTIVWWRGQTKSLRLILLTGTPSEGIGGWTFSFKLYDSLASDAAVSLTKTTGFTIVDAGGSGQPAIVELLLQPADVSSLDPATYYHKWTRAENGIVLDYGPFILNP